MGTPHTNSLAPEIFGNNVEHVIILLATIIARLLVYIVRWMWGVASASFSWNALSGLEGCWNLVPINGTIILDLGIPSTSHETACKWIPQDPISNRSSLVQVMAFCHQAIKSLPESMLTKVHGMMPYGITRTQWLYKWRWNISVNIFT